MKRTPRPGKAHAGEVCGERASRRLAPRRGSVVWRAQARAILGFVGAFLAAIAGLAIIRTAEIEQPAAEMVGRWTAWVAYVALTPVQPGIGVASNILFSSSGALRVAEECSGFELLGLLGAAMIAYPVSWRRRLTGLALLVPFVFTLNVVRVASLSLVLAYHPSAFDVLHTFVWQGLLILFALAYWVLWSLGASAA